MADFALYTAVFGGRDHTPIRPAALPPEVDFFCFTDDETRRGEPGIVYSPPLIPRDNVRSARLLKCMPDVFLPGYLRWIWTDASFRLKEGSDLTVLFHESGLLGTLRHRLRSCPYEEAEVCASQGIDDPETILKQVERYRELGYPAGKGLSETGILVRGNEPRVRDFNALWWKEVSRGSKRDQISFDFSARAAGLLVTHVGTVDDNPWFKYEGHAVARPPMPAPPPDPGDALASGPPAE